MFSLMHLAQTRSESYESTPAYCLKDLLQLIHILEGGSSKLIFFFISDFACSSIFMSNLYFFSPSLEYGFFFSESLAGDFKEEEETGFYSLFLLMESFSNEFIYSLRHLSHEILS